MRTIWKFPLTQPVNDILLPQGSKILTVGMQEGSPCMWVELDPAAVSVPVTVHAIGTGHDVPENPGDYIGTAHDVLFLGLVFHFYAIGLDE